SRRCMTPVWRSASAAVYPVHRDRARSRSVTAVGARSADISSARRAAWTPDHRTVRGAVSAGVTSKGDRPDTPGREEEGRMSELSTDVITMVREHAGRGFGGGIGLEYGEVGPDKVVTTVKVGPHLFQPFGLVHGGVYCAIAEEVASVAGAVWLGGEGRVVGVNNS